MPSHRISGAPLDLSALRTDLGVPGAFAPEVLAAADEAAAHPRLPTLDRTDIAFVTIDPAGSRDLDQAVHIAAAGSGYLVSYAIADVAAFVTADDPVDLEARRRGETLYFPDLRIPLYPPALSENAASLLPDQVRPAVLWQITLDERGNVGRIAVQRALVRSRQQLDYVGVQAMSAAGTLPEAIALLEAVGTRRIALSRARHAINLDLPQQEVEPDGDGGWRLVNRSELDVERWNAEISLLTGACAAQVMLDHRIGILRTLPEPDAVAVKRLRRIAGPLGVTWPDGALPGDVLADLDRTDPHHVAFIEQAASLLRGAGYTAFDGSPPDETAHAGVGSPYAHVTAPLRRLVDRFASSLCATLQAGEPVPAWIHEGLPTLPEIMAGADRLAHSVDRAVVDATEAWLLQDRVGDTFQAVVLGPTKGGAKISIENPPVRATCTGADLEDGAVITVRLTAADVALRSVQFVKVLDAGPQT